VSVQPSAQRNACASYEAADLAGLLEAMARRDGQALGRLYDLTVDRVFATALRVLRNEHDAEEVAADAFRQAWERAADFDRSRGGALGWLLGIAWSRAVDRLRRERRHRQGAEPLHPDAADPAYCAGDDDTAAMVDALASQARLGRAVAGLSAAQQRMIALAFQHDLSHGEIARRVGLPLGTVKSHLRRALIALRQALGQEGDHD
jgi:RNA polymerase sigma-70 factor (ECF subfamily)